MAKKVSGKSRQRQGCAHHALLRKGGVHEKSNGAKRAAAKRLTRHMLRDSKDHEALCVGTA